MPNQLRTIPAFMAVLLAASAFVAAAASAQDPATAGARADLTQANNPLAAFNTLNFQDQYTGRLTGSGRTANTFFLRGAIPTEAFGGQWLVRATLPYSRVPVGNDHETALGDFNIFAAFMINTGIPDASFAIGPQLTAPTATKTATGSGKWSLGLANVLFNYKNPKFQWGYLLTWQASVAGDGNRANVNQGDFQPMMILQLKKGWYLRSTAIWSYDFETDNYNIPIGFGVGRAIKTKSAIVNIFVEPQVSVASRGPGQSEWGVFAGVNFQMPKKK